MKLNRFPMRTKDLSLSSSGRCPSSKTRFLHKQDRLSSKQPLGSRPTSSQTQFLKRMNNLQSGINAITTSISMATTDEAPSPPSTTSAAPPPSQEQEHQQPERELLPAGAVPRTPRGSRNALPTQTLEMSSAPDPGPHARMIRFFAAASINSKNKAGTNSSRSSSSKRKRIIFPMKLMYVLETGEYDDIISWSTDGTAFVVRDPDSFTEKVLQVLLQMSKFESFIRKLSRWGFAKRLNKEGTKIPSAKYGDIFATSTWLCHPSFQKGNFELCKERVICNSKVDIGACTAILDRVQDEQQKQKGSTTHVSNNEDVSGMKSNATTYSLGDASADAVTAAATASGSGTMILSRAASTEEVAVTSKATTHLLRTAYPHQNGLSSMTNLISGDTTLKRPASSSNTNIFPLPGLPGEARTGALQVDRMNMLNGALSFLNQANGNVGARNTEYSDIATLQAISVANARSTGLINTSTLLSHQNQQHMNNLGIVVQDASSRMTNPMQPYEQQQLRQLLQHEQHLQRDLQLRHELQLQLQDEQLTHTHLGHYYEDQLQLQEQLVAMAAANGIRDTNLLSLMISQQVQQQRQQGFLQHIVMPSLEATGLSHHQEFHPTRTRQTPLSTSSLMAASQQRQGEDTFSLLDRGGYTVFGAVLPAQSRSSLPARQHFVDNIHSSGTMMGMNPGAPASILVDANTNLIHQQLQFQQKMSWQLAAIQGMLEEGRQDERI